MTDEKEPKNIETKKNRREGKTNQRTLMSLGQREAKVLIKTTNARIDRTKVS